MPDTDPYIERRITIGFIVSTEYIQQLFAQWNPRLIESDTARTVIGWCLEYFQKYAKAPGRDIENVYMDALRRGMDQDKAEWIEGILVSLSDEYERERFNYEYLLDQTRPYLKTRALLLLGNDITDAVNAGDLEQAEAAASTFASPVIDQDDDIDPFSEDAGVIVEQAFAERQKPLINFPKALGQFWNSEFVRGGFIAFMGPEKAGKSYLMADIAIRGMRAGNKVAYFQAGDMSRNDQLHRFGITLTQRSDDAKYCGELWVPEVDCLFNQTGACARTERERNGNRLYTAEEWPLSFARLVEESANHQNFRSCRNCQHIKGTPWLRRRPPVEPLTGREAREALRRFGQKFRSTRFRLATYHNETLSVTMIRSKLMQWERQYNFIPDIIVIDHADILMPCPDLHRYDFRNQQMKIWQRVRRLSEERRCLVITATWTNAKSYSVIMKGGLINKTHFSEDKRKFGHVTAMYGMNQTDEEKRIGLMRINQVLLREGDFDCNRPVTILQRLQMGLAFIGSYM